jgi:ABC-2 type transport system ATP-binding protein
MHEGRLQAVDTIDALRESAAGGTKLQISVDDPSETHLDTIEAVDGVDSAWIEDETFAVTCPSDVKMDVLVALDAAGVDVLDFSTEEPSLEDLFVEYTREGGQ